MHRSGRATIDRLMQATARNDARAFETLHEILLPILGAFIRRYVNAPSAIDDLVQETFCRLWQTRGRFRGESAASTYIFGIAFNVAREYHHARKPHAPLADDWQGGIDESEIISAIEQAEIRDAIENAKRKLSPDYARAIEMVYQRELRPNEAARDLGCTEKAFRRRLEKARKRLFGILRPKMKSWWE